nr:fimbrial protein [Shewanella algae]
MVGNTCAVNISDNLSVSLGSWSAEQLISGSAEKKIIPITIDCSSSETAFGSISMRVEGDSLTVPGHNGYLKLKHHKTESTTAARLTWSYNLSEEVTINEPTDLSSFLDGNKKYDASIVAQMVLPPGEDTAEPGSYSGTMTIKLTYN